MKGSAGLVGDLLTFKWATVTIGQAAVNTVIVVEVIKFPYHILTILMLLLCTYLKIAQSRKLLNELLLCTNVGDIKFKYIFGILRRNCVQ